MNRIILNNKKSKSVEFKLQNRVLIILIQLMIILKAVNRNFLIYQALKKLYRKNYKHHK